MSRRTGISITVCDRYGTSESLALESLIVRADDELNDESKCGGWRYPGAAVESAASVALEYYERAVDDGDHVLAERLDDLHEAAHIILLERRERLLRKLSRSVKAAA